MKNIFKVNPFEKKKKQIIEYAKDNGKISFEELVDFLKGIDMTEELLDSLYNSLIDAGVSIVTNDDSVNNEELDEFDNENSDGEKVSLYCPRCGTVYDDDTTICPNCDLLLTSIDNNPEYKEMLKTFSIIHIIKHYETPRELFCNKYMPPYYITKYNISNLDLFMNEIIDLGYLQKPNDYELLQSLKVAELKQILRDNGLNESGTKQKLIDRILDEVVDFDCDRYSDKIYILSETGKAFLNNNQDLVLIDEYRWLNISPKDYYQAKVKLSNDNKTISLFDCICYIYSEREKIYLEKKQYDMLYYSYSELAHTFKHAEKYDEMIIYYIKCVIYEMCGIHIYSQLNLYKDGLVDEEYIMSIIKNDRQNNQSLNQIIKYKEYYSEDILESEYNKIDYKLVSYELIKRLINESINNSMFDINDYKELIYRERQKNVKKYL